MTSYVVHVRACAVGMTRRRLRGRRGSRLTAHARTKPHTESGRCACVRALCDQEVERRAGTQERSSRHTHIQGENNIYIHKGDCHGDNIGPCQPSGIFSTHSHMKLLQKALHPPMAGIRAAPLEMCHPFYPDSCLECLLSLDPWRRKKKEHCYSW